jgi:hypothetical protein
MKDMDTKVIDFFAMRNPKVKRFTVLCLSLFFKGDFVGFGCRVPYFQGWLLTKRRTLYFTDYLTSSYYDWLLTKRSR